MHKRKRLIHNCNTIIDSWIDDAQLAELNEQVVEIKTAIPELQEHFGELQKDLVDVVAKHGDTQYVLERYLQVNGFRSQGIHAVH